MKKLATIVAASGLAFGLSACGSGNEAEETVENFYQALKDEDFETVCNTIDPEMIEPLEQASQGKDCVDIMEENSESLTEDIEEDEELNIVDSEIADDEETATVTLEDENEEENEVQLKKVDDEWKISFEE